ncbi:MAG: hypothetical protein H0T90_04115 [Gemmatimonadales bacterium]|nr:hypothetical protein [Gemmatimonadales bacterium]
MGRHLQLWRMDFPPAIALLAEATRAVLGDSLPGSITGGWRSVQPSAPAGSPNSASVSGSGTAAGDPGQPPAPRASHPMALDRVTPAAFILGQFLWGPITLLRLPE